MSLFYVSGFTFTYEILFIRALLSFRPFQSVTKDRRERPPYRRPVECVGIMPHGRRLIYYKVVKEVLTERG